MKSYAVTIQMKPLLQYFHMVLFILSIFFHWPLDIRGVIYLLGRSVGLVRSIWTTRAKSET